MPYTVQFRYLNHHGKMALRTVDVDSVDFQLHPGLGYQSGWFISGFDHDKQAHRSFALSRIILDADSPPKRFVLLSLKDSDK